MLVSFVLFRQCYLYVMANFVSNEVVPIVLGYPAGWVLCRLITLVYYKRTKIEKFSVIEAGEEEAQ